MEYSYTPEEAIEELLGDRQTGDRRTDLRNTILESWDRRLRNGALGGAALEAYHREFGLSWRQIEDEMGIPRTTAARWSAPPPEAPDD